MKPFRAGRALLTALVILAGQAGNALASPVYFEYASRVYAVPQGGGGGINMNSTGYGFIPTGPIGYNSVALLAQQGNRAAAPATIDVAYFNTAYTPPNFDTGPSKPDTKYAAQPFELALFLIDRPSQAQGWLVFRGTFSGNETSAVSFSFSPAKQSLVLGKDKYTVDLTQPPSWQPTQSWMMLSSYGSTGPIQARVTVQPAPSPEPTGLALASLGLVTLCGGLGRRGRRAA
jgi:hypothetical protein